MLFDPKDLLVDLSTKLKLHKSSEKRNIASEDKLLIGLMSTIRKILSHESTLKETVAIKEGLISELFVNCLFPSILPTSESTPTMIRAESQETSNMDSQKCKTKESRSAAYKLLATLSQGSSASQTFLVKDCMEPLCKSIKSHAGWNYTPSSESRSKLGFAGIENLGCICYMISMIQQFYMIPTFRYWLVNANDKKPPTGKKPGDIDDNVLHQMQRIFAHLELTERQAYNPRHFTYSFKDMDGNPTNISIQQDSQEFLNLVFDRLENLLRGTPEKYLLNSVFGGKTCSQIVCKGGCGSVRNTYEDFYNLSLGVKGHRTLAESLTKYIAGDTISDFNCEKCQKKVNVVKRTLLQDLPNVLIVHLQRIIFNFDSLMNEKINSRLEFPQEFNIKPYTVEGVEEQEKKLGAAQVSEEEPQAKIEREDDYYNYKLVGVVVHLGTADVGHYYSYINTNRRSKNRFISI